MAATGTPVADMHRWRQTDMHYYAQWGSAIAAGDWLSASLPLPMHRWHREIAALYWTEHPAEKTDIPTHTRDPDEALWSRWMRVPQFYQDPLYAYLVAAMHVTRVPVRATIVLQLLAGTCTILLIWSLTRHFFDDPTAALAGGAALLSGPLLFYESLLLRDSLIACAGLLIVWLVEQARHRRPHWTVVAGSVAGAACLLKSTFALLSVIFFAALLIEGVRGRRMPWRAVWFACGCALAVSPVVVRNIIVQAPPLSLATSGPLTFVAANAPGANPDVGFGIDAPLLMSFLGSTDGSWMSAISTAFKAQTVEHYAALLFRKWDRVWHWYEIPNNENFYYARRQIPLLAYLPVTFWICGPLAAVGVLLALPRWRQSWPLLVLVVTTIAPLLAFYVLGRFRLPLAAALIPFAAFGAIEISRAVSARRIGRAASLVGATIVCALWMGRPLSADQALIRTSDWILPWSVEYESRVYGALDARDPKRAAIAYLEFFQHTPTAAEIAASGDPRLPLELADMHRECAQILRAAGRTGDADVQLAIAQKLSDIRVER